MAKEQKENPFSQEQLSKERPDFSNQPEKPVSPEEKEGESQVIQPEKGKKEKSKTSAKVGVGFPKKEKEEKKIEKSETLESIENILSNGLEEAYQNLPSDLKNEFKEKGEETASKIENLLYQTKVMVHKIVDLIKDWLSLLPGVNKFFLEQETKIKTERILNLKKEDQKNKIE